MSIPAYPLLRSALSYVLPKSVMSKPGSGGTFSAEYCYSVWLRHLVYLHEAGLITSVHDIKKMAEIGPGDSLGIGITGLLSGVDEYYAFDVIEHASNEKNKVILLELFQLLIERKEIPHKSNSLRNTKPVLSTYDFPSHLFDQTDNQKNIQDRSEAITKALDGEPSSKRIQYLAPWYEKNTDQIGGLDLIYSQAVMEHVLDITHAYQKMYAWLRPGGVISHQIDYKAHEMHKEWNGHWYFGQRTWDFLLRGRKYPINRLPHSAHVSAIEEAGFQIKRIIPFHSENTFGDQLPKVANVPFSEDDFTISSALIQAVKPKP